MTLKISRQSREELARVKNLERLTKSGIEHGLFISARQMRKSAQDEITKGVKTGRLYPRVTYTTSAGTRKVKRNHRASAPGETHANISGKLKRSIGWRISWQELDFGYGFQTRSPAPYYAKFVEFGTVKMAERPSLKNAIEANEANLVRNLTDEIGKRLEGVGGFLE